MKSKGISSDSFGEVSFSHFDDTSLGLPLISKNHH
jgi:hypothetical protein